MSAHIGAPEADIIIVGAGLGGLTGGIELARSGRRVIIFEAGAPGGRARSVERAGATLNVGPHALYSAGEAARWLEAAGILVEGHAPDLGRPIFKRGDALTELPLGPWGLLRTTGLRGLERWEALRALATLPRLEAAHWRGRSAQQWVDATASRPGARALLATLARLTTYAGDLERIDAELAIRQLRLGQAGVRYLDGGWQSLVLALLAAYREAGGILHARSPVRALRCDRDGAEVEVADKRWAARGLILAAGPRAAERWLPELALAPAEPLEVACLDLVLRALPRPERRFALDSEASLYFSIHSHSARLSEGGEVVAHAMASRASADAEARIEAFLDALQAGWRGEVIARRFSPRLRAVADRAAPERGGLAGRRPVTPRPDWPLWLAGDEVGARGWLADAAVASGLEAARCACAAIRAEELPSHA